MRTGCWQQPAPHCLPQPSPEVDGVLLPLTIMPDSTTLDSRCLLLSPAGSSDLPLRMDSKKGCLSSWRTWGLRSGLCSMHISMNSLSSGLCTFLRPSGATAWRGREQRGEA